MYCIKESLINGFERPEFLKRGIKILILLSRVISALPLSVALWIGRVLGVFAYYCIPIRRSMAFQNVKHVLGDKLSKKEQKKLVLNCYKQQGMYTIEVFRIPSLTSELADELVEPRGKESLDEAFGRKKGVILVSAHIGNVDLAGCSMAIRGIPISIPARTIRSEMVRKLVIRIRENTGVLLIAPHRSKDVIKQQLKENKMVTLIVDQHMSKRRSIVCEFFGKLASTSPAPARFAFETGATIVLAVIHRQGFSGKHVIEYQSFELETPHTDLKANIRHNTERINRYLEEQILTYPEHWLWLHRRWKVQEDPEGWEIPENLQHLVTK
ncbi:MAG: lysophospholipid acyltransferase family protein [Deltaproteobacteria bacterium]|nr:lysophospholipid acyltransferase family protein [Deltaproteobacteria bacterium]